MLLEALGAARDLGRLHDIASILIRFGFGDTVRRLGMGAVLEKAGKVLHWQEAEELARLEPPQRIRRAMEELGPSFVKLGQVLSTRIDLFPSEYIEEFKKLQNQVPPLPFHEIVEQLEEDLGGPIADVLDSVDLDPLAAASIAQVHQATLKTGEKVILKIRRPGIRDIINADLRLLKRLADIADDEMIEMLHFDPKKIVAEFAKSIRGELDFANECRNAERISDSFKDNPSIVVPKVYWQWTCERLNVQEMVVDIPGSDMDAVDAAGFDRESLAKIGAEAVLKMVFEDGFFHADLHPGNVFYRSAEQIVMVDFGMVGRISQERRYQLVDLLYGVVMRQSDRVAETLMLWSGEFMTDNTALASEIDDFIDRVHGVPLKSLNFVDLTSDLIVLLRTHHLSLPSDLTLLIKALVSLDGMGRQLAPDFDMMSAAKPFLRHVMMIKYSPKELAKRGQKGIVDGFDLMAGLPKDVWDLVKIMRSGRFQFHMEIEHMEHFLDRLDKSITRITIGIVIAALIMGSSIVMTVAGGKIPIGLEYFSMVGFAGAVLGGLWMIFSIWRGR
jgi:ubiquinone biosynthesis protein